MGLNECKAIAKIAADILEIEPPEVQIKHAVRGRAKIKQKIIVIPKWAGDYHEAFWTYYVVHEVCHFRSLGHGPAFKKLEQMVCDYFGIEIVYKKAYPKMVKFHGEVIYG